MTSPAVERVRHIPLIVQNDVAMAVDGEDDNSGFPFDRDLDRDRDDSLRSQLDDIAKRHPEFAEHLEGFPFRTDSLGRRSRPPRPSDESEFRRFAGRPFGSGRFERFGYPFGRDPFDEDFERPEEHTRSHQPPEQPQPQRQQTPPPQQQEDGAAQKQQRSRRQNIQPSNTVDLGQKQEPVNDRNQRSMSAPPPDNRTGQQRFVSSINIPINRDGGMGDMGAQQSQAAQQHQEKAANKPTERVIPIHVEGRDEPVMPKHTGPSFGQSPQPERVFGQSPQTERIFGHRPSQFTQFVGREPPRQFTSGAEWHHPAYAKQQEAAPTETMRPQPQQQQKFQQQQVPPQRPPKEQTPPPQQQQQQHQQQQQQQPKQQQQQQQQQPQPQQPKSSGTPIDLIQSIQRDVSELMGQVEKFNGMPKDKQYLYLDEMLTRNLIKLDNIDTQGQENIRQARKEAIKCIERCIGVLEAKAAANVPKQELPSEEAGGMEVETKNEEQPQTAAVDEQPKTEESQPVVEERMDVEVSKESENVSEAKVEEKVEEQLVEAKMEQQPIVEEKMEVIAEPAVLVEPKSEQQEPPKPTVEEKSSESCQENKPSDEDMIPVPEEQKQADGEAAKESSQEEKKEEDDSEDKKDKKKGKKKVVKK